jgi:hypothetical protein
MSTTINQTAWGHKTDLFNELLSNSHHGPQSFLRTQHVLSNSKVSHNFMGLEGSWFINVFTRYQHFFLSKSINSFQILTFWNWGSHSDGYEVSYLLMPYLAYFLMLKMGSLVPLKFCSSPGTMALYLRRQAHLYERSSFTLYKTAVKIPKFLFNLSLQFYTAGRKTKDSRLHGSSPSSHLLLVSYGMQFLPVSVVPKYLECVTFWEVILIIFILVFCPEECTRTGNHYYISLQVVLK